MKILIFLFFIILSAASYAKGFQSPDILVYSRLDYDWSNVLVTKVRQLFKNYLLPDPLTAKLQGNVKLNQSKVGALLPQKSKSMISDFGNAVGLSLLNGETQVWLKDLSYDVKGLRADMRVGEKLMNSSVIGVNVSASDLYVSAEKISFSLVIPGSKGSPVFNVDIVKPYIQATRENVIQFYSKFKILNNQDHYKFQIQGANFDKMSDNLLKNDDGIDLNYERIIIPKVSLQVGNKKINFDPEKVEKLIRSKHSEIKGIIFAQVANMMNANTVSSVNQLVEKYKLSKDVLLAPTVPFFQGMLNLSDISSAGTNGIDLKINGDFCTIEAFGKLNRDCVNQKITKPAPSKITEADHNLSIEHMANVARREDSALIASISEDFLNKIIVSTYDAGSWKEALDEAGVTLGPGKVTLRMAKKGQTAMLVLDVLYKPTKVERTLTGTKQIRFPLVLDVGVRIDVKEEIPTMIIQVQEIDTSDDTLLKGVPREGISSNVKDIPRFKKKVAQSIRQRLTGLKGKDMIEVPFEQFKGIGIEKIDLESDGHGRISAELGLKDFAEEFSK